tara:strand:+ start:1102 stop:1434 length:333 start_codon:yes stop_codon:yes gene_type:complete
MSNSKVKFEELMENELAENKSLRNNEKKVLEDVFGDYWVSTLSRDVPTQLESPPHYSNENGSLYKIGLERGWNPYQFDAIKRIDRAYKKGNFKEDIEKTELVLKLMLKNE